MTEGIHEERAKACVESESCDLLDRCVHEIPLLCLQLTLSWNGEKF